MSPHAAGVGWRSSRQLVSEQFRWSAMAYESVMGIRNEVSIDGRSSKTHSGNLWDEIAPGWKSPESRNLATVSGYAAAGNPCGVALLAGASS